MYTYFYDYLIGRIGITEKDGKITNVYITSKELLQDTQLCETPLLKEAARQLKSYLQGAEGIFLTS